MKCLRPRLDKAPKGDWYCDECNPRPIIVTCWTPLGDVPLAHGGLYVLPGSQLYGDLDQRVPMTQVRYSFMCLDD